MLFFGTKKLGNHTCLYMYYHWRSNYQEGGGDSINQFNPSHHILVSVTSQDPNIISRGLIARNQAANFSVSYFYHY